MLLLKILVISTVEYGYNGITNVIRSLYLNDLYINDSVEFIFPRISGNGFIDPSMKNHLYILNRYKNAFIYSSELLSIMHANKYDIIHVHGNSHTIVLELALSKLAGCKNVVAHAHSTNSTHRLLHYLLTPFFDRLYDIGLACSDSAGAFMFGNKPFQILHNGIEVERFRYDKFKRDRIRNELGISRDTVLLGHVGYFSSYKNQSFLINLMPYLNNNYKLLLIGDGELKESCMQSADSRTIILDNTDDVCDYLSAMDLLLFPSLFEGLGLVLIEAQASGLKCLASCYVPEVVNITGDVVFLPLSYSDWKEKIDQFGLKHDRDIQSEKNCELINDAGFSSLSSAKRLYSIYNHALLCDS